MQVARRLLAGLFLASFGVALALGALEVAVRVLHLVPARFWKPDALLGTVHVPGQTGWWTQEENEFRVPVHINSQGLRDVEHSVAKAPGVFRLLLLGDSYIEALQVPLDQTIGRQLEQRLNASGGAQRYEVISMGVSGYGTASQYLYYREQGRNYRPDLVLLALYPGNDVRNNSPTLEPTLRPEYDDTGALRRVSAKVRRGSRRRGLLQEVLAWSQAYQYMRKMVLTRNPAAARLLIGGGLMRADALRHVPMHDGVPVDYWVYAATPSPEWEAAWAHTWRLLTDLRDAVKADGGQFAILMVTARDHIYPDSWEQVLAAHPRMAELRWDLGGPEARSLAWCQQSAVPCLPLTPVFAARRESGERLHFTYDGHWTVAGHALAAEAAAGFLEKMHLLLPR